MKILFQNITKKDWVHGVPRIIIVIILAQTLPFKFLADQESVYIFSQLNMEPLGRIFVGCIELISVILLLSPYYILGSIFSLSIISAANFYHIVKLGIVVQDDGGLLFFLSIVVVLCSLWIIIYWNRKQSKKVNFNQITSDIPPNK